MIQSKLFRLAVGICVFCLGAAPLFGQAVFSVSSSQPKAADIGVTELTGQIVLAVQSGTSVPAQFQVQYSAQVTNNAASEISITGTGNLAGIAHAPILYAEGNLIIFTVPAGGTAGNQITIQGVRVAIAGQNYTSVTASIAVSANTISAGQTVVTVINSILQPLAVDMSATQSLSFARGVAINATSSFIVKEGFASAFSSSVGTYGQTIPTEIRITPYAAIPSGVTVTFPATVTADSGATLTTTSTADETIPRDDGTTSVVYEFAGSSTAQIDAFTITVSMTVSPTAGTGSIDFQIALVPIGIATPATSSPSTDIPRYWERIIPDPSELPASTVELAFPFRAQSDATYTGFALTNPLSFSVNVTLTPYDGSGSAIMDPVTLTIPPNGQTAKLATDADVFGPSFNATSAGTIRAVGRTPTLVGFYLLSDVSGPRLDGATAEENLLGSWTWPVIFRQAPAPFTTFEMFNPSTATATAGLTLYDSNGTLISTSSRSINAYGTVTQGFEDLFPGISLNSFNGGYVIGQSDVSLVVRETFGNSLDSNVLPGQAGQALNTIYLPHFASGGGYTTELTLVNADLTLAANLTVTLLDDNGTQIASPATISIQPRAQTIQTLAVLFPGLTASLTTGYIRIDEAQTFKGPFGFMPSIVGSLRFSLANGSSSSALPLITPSASEFVYSHVAEAAGYWTGIAILNTNSTSASVSLQVFTAGGASLGTKTLTLQPGQKTAQLLDGLVPAAAGKSGGYIHITSSVPVTSFSLFGTNDGRSLSAIPLQNIGD
jgi:hypothetical protein